MKPIKISIITVCYNATNTIRRTLESVSAQTYEHIEYIVIDGASKDNTLQLVAELAPQAQVYSEPDKGIYDAMNKGLAVSTGEYVWFMNAGDALPNNHIVTDIVARIEEHDIRPDVVYGDCELIDDKGVSLGLRRLRPPHDLNWRSFIGGMLVCHQSFVARRELCPPYNMSYRFSSDVDWCIRVMKEARSYLRMDEPLSLYLHEGATTANHRRSLLERFQVMRQHYGLFSTIIAHIGFLLGIR